MTDLDACRAALPMPELLSRLGKPDAAKKSALCIFHDETRPSAGIFKREGRWNYKCHSCGVTADEVSLIEKLLGLNNGSAIRYYAELAGVNGTNNLSGALNSRNEVASKVQACSPAQSLTTTNLSVPVLAEPSRTTTAEKSVSVGEARESTTASGSENKHSGSRGAQSLTNLSGGSNAGDVRWQLDSKSKDLCNPYREETQAPPAQSLTMKAIQQLAKWRGYSQEFVEKLACDNVVMLYDKHIAFPVTNGWHYRLKDGSWRYSPGAKAELFVLGKIEEGAHVHCFESQWDALAFADSQGEWNNIVATRGASNAKLIADRLREHTGTLYLWPQNDKPGIGWAYRIRELLPSEMMKIVTVPLPAPDLNEWRKAGATDGDVFNSFVDAKDFHVPVLAESTPVSVVNTSDGRGEALESTENCDRTGSKAGSMAYSSGVENTLPVPDDYRTERLVSPPGTGNSLSKILDDITAFLCRYVVFPLDEQALAIALWVSHTHVFEAFRFSPYLHICSPEKRCGKTRLLECIQLLVPRPRSMVRPSEPVLFRTIEREKPTLLLDEVDTIFGRDSEESGEGLRAVLNAGFQAGAKIPRCVGNTFELAEFSVFCPKVIAGIGKIPDTVRDRSIDIRLVRQTSDAKADRFRLAEAQSAAIPMRAELENWSKVAIAPLSSSRPHIPDQLTDRQADMFEPLLAISDMAGADWPEKGREALIALSAAHEDQSAGVQLLSSCREIFSAKSKDALPTHELLDSLISLESSEAPWAGLWEADIKRGNTKTPAMKLARMLEPYGIKPATIRLHDDETAKGYHAHDFRDAWRRYLAPVTGLVTMELL